MTRYEIYLIDIDGDEYYTGDYFFDYDITLDTINRLNEIDEDRTYIIKECYFLRKER